MMRATRRDFLATTSIATAGLALSLRPGVVRALPRSILRSPNGADAVLPARLAPADLQAMATRAVDAARSAGATYADIRVSERQQLTLSFFGGDLVISTDSTYDYGVRTLVHGATAFVHGTVPTLDAIAAATQRAVATARGYAALAPRQTEFARVPVVTGSWTTPIQIDPFTVPLGAQVDLMYALLATAERALALYSQSSPTFHWERETRVFGSSEGSLVTQTFYRSKRQSNPGGQATLFPNSDIRLAGFEPTSAGYESVLAPDLQERLLAAVEEAVRHSKLPVRNFDVGRFPVVLDGLSLGAVLGISLGQALELDRAIGRETDAAGSSFLAPPKEILGGVVVNPLLNVTGNRKMPSIQAVQWDDDGVVPEEFTLMKAGQVVDYCTTRETAGNLGAWYQSKDKAMRSNGCAVANRAENPVETRMPHLHVAPGTQTASIEDLYRDVSRGLLVLQSNYVSMDQQLTSGLLAWGQMYEIVRGTIVRRVQNTALSLTTRGFWKNLMALGDVNTLRESHFVTVKGYPWRSAMNAATAPAGRFNAVDVISTGRTLT